MNIDINLILVSLLFQNMNPHALSTLFIKLLYLKTR